MKIRFFETCGHNKLCPYKDGVLFNTLIICLLKPFNRFADEPYNGSVLKCSKQELDASRRSYRELTDKCQVAVIQAIVS